jgi:YVTN family beta-propeller protein
MQTRSGAWRRWVGRVNRERLLGGHSNIRHRCGTLIIAAFASFATPAAVDAALPTGTLVRPAGTQLSTVSRPMGLALSPDGRRLLVTGQGLEQALMVVDTRSGRTLQRIAFARPRALAGSAVFSPDGARAYVAGGGSRQIWRFAVRRRGLIGLRPLQMPPFVRRNEIARGLTQPYPAGLAISLDGRRLYVADELGDAIVVIGTSGTPIRRIAVGDGPLAMTLSPDGRWAYVANASGHSVSLVDLRSLRVEREIQVGPEPVAVVSDPAAHELYVANSDGDSISVIDTHAQRVLRTIRLTDGAAATAGHSPIALAVDHVRRRLYVAAAADNDVDVIALAKPRRGGDRLLGRIPTGWYPSALVLQEAGRKLLVANAKGMSAERNDASDTGTLSEIVLPDPALLARFTATVQDNNRCRTSCDGADRLGNLRRHISHIIYILKENRAYDDVFADLGSHAQGHPRFDDNVAPNHRALARRFVLLDNFHAAGEVSPDGKAWSLGGFADAYIERNWPATYSFRNRPSDYLGSAAASTPPRGHLWDSLARAGRTFRNYGVWASGTIPVRIPASARALGMNTDANFPGYNRRFSDQRRAEAFLTEFHAYERRRRLPDFIFMTLNNDHLLGTKPGYRTPEAMMADNDLALGRVVAAVSHSRFWRRTAIFVVEDDAQGAAAGTRTPALVISPYTQRAAVDSTRYSTPSVLRTMELIMGVEPLSQFDGTAPTMAAVFDVKSASLRPYDALIPRQRLDELNRESIRLTFALGVVIGLALGSCLTVAVRRRAFVGRKER